MSGSVQNLIAGGKMAAGLADKVMGGLNVPGTPPSPEGVSKGLFDKIKEGFKALTAGTPQNLTEINAKNKAEQSLTDALPVPKDSASSGLLASAASVASKVKDSITSQNVLGTLENAFKNNASQLGIPAGAVGLGLKLGSSLVSSISSPTGLGNLPGGANSVSNLVKGNSLPSVPGTDGIKASLNSISGAASGMMDTTSSVVNGFKDKLQNASLASFASLGLNPNDLAKLNGAINSVSAGGAQEIKLPTVAEATNSVNELAAQSKNLLGNPKIPPLSFGAAPPTDSSSMLARIKARNAALDGVMAKQKAYEDSLAKTGSRIDPETSAAFAEWRQALADMDNLG